MEEYLVKLFDPVIKLRRRRYLHMTTDTILAEDTRISAVHCRCLESSHGKSHAKAPASVQVAIHGEKRGNGERETLYGG